MQYRQLLVLNLRKRSSGDNLALPSSLGSGGCESTALFDSRGHLGDLRFSREGGHREHPGFLGSEVGAVDEWE
jgi:hypothetical protein